jgi:hypothetical protein
MTDDIKVSIPAELTAAMIIRAGVIKDEARALEIAHELHAVVAQCVKLRLAEKRSLVELPSDEELERDPEAEPVELEPARGPNALEIADFTLACWKQAMVGYQITTGRQVTPDGEEGAWISEELAALTLGHDPLYRRWCAVCNAITGSDLALMLTDGGMQ